MSYRTFYEQKTGRKLPSDWDVHHIDQNRSNNDIENLIAIPAVLHKKYHSIYNELSIELATPDLSLSFLNINTGVYRMQRDYLIKISGLLDQFFVYVAYKEFLLGRFAHMEHLY